MKGKFDAYALWPLAKMIQNWKVDQSTALDFTVIYLNLWEKGVKKLSQKIFIGCHDALKI